MALVRKPRAITCNECNIDHYVIQILNESFGTGEITFAFAAAGPTKNLKEVQNDLMGFINADTILVGHGLENDLRALSLVHATVLDTAVVFPHFYGLPFRRSLRSLAASYLKRDIQVRLRIFEYFKILIHTSNSLRI